MPLANYYPSHSVPSSYSPSALWDGLQITLDQPHHRTRPGLAQYALWAGYQDAAGKWLLLLSDGMDDPTMQILDLAYATLEKKEILWGACLDRASSKWNVAHGESWSIQGHAWIRQTPEFLKIRFDQSTWKTREDWATLLQSTIPEGSLPLLQATDTIQGLASPVENIFQEKIHTKTPMHHAGVWAVGESNVSSIPPVPTQKGTVLPNSHSSGTSSERRKFST